MVRHSRTAVSEDSPVWRPGPVAGYTGRMESDPYDVAPQAVVADNLVRRPHTSGDGWVDGEQGRFWGKFGAAGLLVVTPRFGVLLQHRASWSHIGDTWGLPGGARNDGESAEDAALREAGEEAGVPRDQVRLFATSVRDLGYWSYTTVLGVAAEPFTPVIADAESQDLRWVRIDTVTDYPLHPGFAQSWPELQPMINNELQRSNPAVP